MIVSMCFKVFNFTISLFIGKTAEIFFKSFPQAKLYLEKILLANELDHKLNEALFRLDKAECTIESLRKEVESLKFELRGGSPISEVDSTDGDNHSSSIVQPPIPKPRLSIRDSKIPTPPPMPDFPLTKSSSATITGQTPAGYNITPEPDLSLLEMSTKKSNKTYDRQKPSSGELQTKRNQLKTARSPGGTPLGQRLQGTTKDYLQSRASHRVPTIFEEELRQILKVRRPPTPDNSLQDSSFEQDFSFT